MIQIRNVPDKTHRKLKARAAIEGMTLSDYLLKEIQHVADLPSVREFSEHLKRRDPINPPVSAAEIIREMRDAH
jgi:hypothetical protein